MLKATSNPKRTIRQLVLQAIIDLNEHNQPASRQRVAEMTGLKATAVDDQIHLLKADGLVRGVANGYYEYVDQTLDRAVTTTHLPGGRIKLEIGDEIITNLTPREALALAKQFGGLLFAFGAMTPR